MFYTSRTIALSDPLLESITFQNTTFPIVGICVDPLNNGQVAYVPIDQLENATGISNPNLLIIKRNGSIDRQAAIAQINSTIQAADPDLQVFDLSGIVQQNTNFLSSTWQTIMLLPLFTLASAALCLVGYMMLAVDEQRQEFGILRAVGAKPRIIIDISAIKAVPCLSPALQSEYPPAQS